MSIFVYFSGIQKKIGPHLLKYLSVPRLFERFRRGKYHCDEIQISHNPPHPSWVDLMFAHRLLAGPSVGVAVGPEALSVTSCSILFLCCCASALCPSGLTLRCSFNNCCGTVNICKPLLQLARLCAGLLCVFSSQIFFFFFPECRILWCWSSPVWVVASAPESTQRVSVFWDFLLTEATIWVNKLGS